jgi:hypothetical protein
MTLQQTLGGIVDVLSKKQVKEAKEKVKEVEDQQRFVAVKNSINQMVSAANPANKKQTEAARDNAIALQIQFNAAFGLAVKQRLFQFLQTGQ